jgi:LCP family protein required for cell wall assembly
MQREQEVRPRARSPFVAAVLSLFFPGLGHAYAGAYQRAIGFAALPILSIALGAGLVLRASTSEMLQFALNDWFLPGLFVVNILILLYRLLAIVDSYRVAAYLNGYAASGSGRLGTPRLVFNPLSVAGLLAVILVMSGGHVVVARYDMLAQSILTDPCVFISNDPNGTANCDETPSDSPGASVGPTDSPLDSPTPVPSEPPIQGSALPSATIQPWNGKDRLNVLLIGSDQRPAENTYNTDTLIVASIDPVTKQVAMFSLPRDSTDVPLPPGTPLFNAYGGVYPNKINSLFTAVRNRADLVPGNSKTRGYNALKEVLGNLYQLDIKYFVEVNFDGFRQVFDAVGGVTINVQVPVIDDSYPADDGRHARIYIPAGIQHMTGAQALIYARSRHGSDDFDRGYRQQRVLTSLREQVNVIQMVPKISALLAAFKQTVRTDIPQSALAQLAGLGSSVDTKDIRSYVFSLPRYGTQTPPGAPVYKYFPDVNKIRAAVKAAFTVDPQLEDTRNALADEQGAIWVLSGGSQFVPASQIAGYLEYYGLTASAPNGKGTAGLAATRIVVYNGAETKLPETIKFLEQKFKVTVQLKNDPAVSVDIIMTTGASTPNLAAPPTG